MDVVTECNHHFHTKCIHTWLNRSQSCPNCRSPLVECQIRPLDDATLHYGQIDQIMKLVYLCVSQIRGMSVNHYTDDLMWSIIQNEWQRLSDGHTYTPNSTKNASLDAFKLPLHVCSQTIQSLHSKTKCIFVHIDSHVYVDLYVSCGTWRVRPAFYCNSVRKFIRIGSCDETILGALIPSYWEHHDVEAVLNKACKVIWLNFYNWLRCNVECSLLSNQQPDASLYTV